MRKSSTLFFLLLALLTLSSRAFSQVSLTSSASYTQNFNSLANSGTNTWTDNSTIVGWYTNRVAYIGDNGGSTTGALYSYGASATNERALGALTSGSTTTVNIGVRIVNNTGFAISNLAISFTGEQWRQTTNAHVLVFDYQIGATSLTTGTWTANTAFNFTAPKTGTAGALDGNVAANQVAISGNLPISLAAGQEIWLRWTKTGSTSPGLAIDDITITPTLVASVNADLSNLVLSTGTLAPPFASATTSYTASVSNSTTSITVTPTAADANATIKVNGTTVASGTASTPISLIVGNNTINVDVTAQNGTTIKTYTVVVNRAAAGVPAISASALADFGNVCINNTGGPNSFTLDGSNLDGTAITVGPLTGFSFSETSGGPYTSSISFTYTGSGFSAKPIYVEFTPTAVQSYNGSIPVSGGGATAINEPVTGSGINTPAAASTGSNNVSGTSATMNGSITSTGCSAVTAYGFEYSITANFPTGSGTQLQATNLSGGNFSAQLTGLQPNRRYYYRAYVTTSAGTSYGAQQAFTIATQPVVMSSQPNFTYTETFTDIANWGDFFAGGIGAEHFAQAISTNTNAIYDPGNITANTVFQTNLSGSGVQRGTDQQTNPSQSIVLLSTGATDNTTSTAFDLYLNFTGVNAGTLSFDYQSLNNSTGNRNASLRVYATTDGVNFSEVTNVLNFTNNAPISGSKTNIVLPASFNNSATARLRFYFYNGTGGTTGSRPKLSIDNITITAVATTPCVAPTGAPTSLTFGTITDVSIAGSFTAASPAADQYLVIASTNNSLTSNPVNGSIYNVGDNVGDGTVVAKSNGTSFTATGLSASTQYYFFIFAANAVCTGGPLYNTSTILTGQASTTAGLPPCAAPTDQPTNLTFSTTTTNSIQGSFTANTASEFLVVRSTSATLSNAPVDGHAYSTGEVLGNGIVVQRSGATSFTASNLSPNTTYYFFVFSANAQACVNGPAFNSASPLTASTATQPLPPCVTPGAQPSNLFLRTSNTAVSGTYASGMGADDYLVVRSTAATLSATPSDNTDYVIGDNIGGGVVVANSGNNTFLNTGLTPGVTYYYFVFAANKNCSGGTKYLTTLPLTGSITTSNAVTYNYYFGTLHSHSDYSDGNQDNPGYTPTDDYNYAMTAQCMDYLGISEHNHFSSPDNPGNKISTYHQGLTEATNFSAAHPSFLALYGMEWGVISGGGHVVVYGNGMNSLFGWESGSGEWGPTNNYDVYVAKNDYTGANGLFKTINDNVATNTFASLAHPNLTDYNNLANSPYNAVADSAITATAVESGPASSTNTTYSNPGSSMSYLWYYQTLLAKGYHLGPVIDHDNHKTTFGHTTYSRTAVVAPALTKADLVYAMRNMHFYATQDCDSKVDFSINTFSMGSVVTDRYAPAILATLTDATTTTSNAVIRLMYGQPGSGILPVQIDSVIGNTYNYIDNGLANLATGYYYIDISNFNSATNSTSRIVTAPIWYTRNDNNGFVLPVKLSSFTGEKQGTSAKLNWVTSQEINAKDFVVERSVDGVNFKSLGSVTARGNSSAPTSYNFVDAQPATGNNYYRLKLVDNDNKFEYSNVVKINFAKAFTVFVSPNPASDHVVVNVSGVPQSLILQLVNASGKLIKTTTLSNGTNRVSVAGLPKGLYLLKFVSANDGYTEKLIVQ
ncbi:cadherin-like beta sandwich domain-containing protein [Flavisolibacter ginsenosidimutans]|uniref:T9SS type A sorting domain-containing protein n=1 Tax=Flavisolibacter ginsenosidimutans TaxID=661481 RepID=A0A5B8UNZ4_9BACT|nr:cadherin-like beta sandwich domain-containing protein [Flavisolibacter ginsenosidimutans]QEC58176.1 T9SS type A sorting domain-containing protein [Flavisolibacter ginsenosidimutans]